MHIFIDNRSGAPIYEQIFTQIKNQILSGELPQDSPLPSIRNLAKDLRISVITTKRAYEELEHDGFIENFPGKGCFVKAQNPAFLREETLRQTEALLEKACQRAKLGGLTMAEMMQMLELMYGGNEDA